MSMYNELGGHNAHLGDAYDAQSASELAAVYDRWSDNYDDYMDSVGYRHPEICLALLTRYVPPGDGKLLDAGVGTGIVGELLAILGYNAIDGIDISRGMLDKAAKKSLYADLRVVDIIQLLALSIYGYRAVISSGFLPPEMLAAEDLASCWPSPLA